METETKTCKRMAESSAEDISNANGEFKNYIERSYSRSIEKLKQKLQKFSSEMQDNDRNLPCQEESNDGDFTESKEIYRRSMLIYEGNEASRIQSSASLHDKRVKLYHFTKGLDWTFQRKLM